MPKRTAEALKKSLWSYPLSHRAGRARDEGRCWKESVAQIQGLARGQRSDRS